MRFFMKFFLTFFLFVQLSLQAQEKVTLCLTMMVKNEENTILKCLESSKGLCDCISIYDTGSTDHTCQIIKEFLQTSGMKGKLIQNGEENLTQALLAAKNTLRYFQLPLEHSYLLIVDANTLLKPLATFKKENLEKSAYSLLHHSSLLPYYDYKPHLMKASVELKLSRNLGPLGPSQSASMYQVWNPYQSENPYAIYGRVLQGLLPDVK